MDEISRDTAQAFKIKPVPIWVTFGIQILLDIQDILGPGQAEAPCHELHHLLDQETAAVKTFKEN
jgi:hypothetical protein